VRKDQKGCIKCAWNEWIDHKCDLAFCPPTVRRHSLKLRRLGTHERRAKGANVNCLMRLHRRERASKAAWQHHMSGTGHVITRRTYPKVCTHSDKQVWKAINRKAQCLER
jgi:hypothetical protein